MDNLIESIKKIVNIIENLWRWRKVLLTIVGLVWGLFCLHKLILVLHDYKDFFGGKKND